MAKPESDLDIVIYADEPITTDEVKSLCALASSLPTAVDIRVKTRTCGFSLKESLSTIAICPSDGFHRFVAFSR